MRYSTYHWHPHRIFAANRYLVWLVAQAGVIAAFAMLFALVLT